MRIHSHPNSKLVKYTLARGDEVIGYTVFRSQDEGFDIADTIRLQGWQHQENRFNVLIASKENFVNEI